MSSFLSAHKYAPSIVKGWQLVVQKVDLTPLKLPWRMRIRTVSKVETSSPIYHHIDPIYNSHNSTMEEGSNYVGE